MKIQFLFQWLGQGNRLVAHCLEQGWGCLDLFRIHILKLGIGNQDGAKFRVFIFDFQRNPDRIKRLPVAQPFLPKRAEKLRSLVSHRASMLATDGSMPCTLSGVVRSMITFQARIVQPQSSVDIGSAIASSIARHCQNSSSASDMPPMHESISCRAKHKTTVDAPREVTITIVSNTAENIASNC